MRLLFFIATISILFAACKDPGTIGAGLLDGEEFIISEIEISDIPGKVVRGDSVTINSTVVTKSLGVLDEPVFGTTINQLFLNTSFNTSPPNFEGATLDSVVLRINLLEDYQYGDADATHLVELFQMTNPYAEEFEMAGDSLTTFTEFEYDESNLLGQVSFIPNYEDEITLDAHTSDTTTLVAPQLRIKLDDSFGQLFIDDLMNTAADSNYMEVAKGFVLRSTPSTSSMIGLDFGIVTNRSLDFYYTNDDDSKSIYPFNIGSSSHLNVKHEYDGSGSAIEAALNDPSEDQELLYVESYSGTFAEFDLSAIKDYEDEIINHASLEITLAEIPEYDNELFASINNFSLSIRNDDGELRVISDILVLDQKDIAFIEEFFGGNPFVNGLTGETKYTMNITSHVKELLAGEHDDNYKVILSNFAKFFEANRSIINGNGSDGVAPKLKLVISKP